MSAITDIHVVGVPVSDQDRALAFYTGVLGLSVRMDAPMGPGMRWLELGPEGAVTGLALVAGPRTGVDTGIRLATTDAAGDRDAMAAAGADVDRALIEMGPDVPPMFTVRDPDGNTLYVVEVGG